MKVKFIQDLHSSLGDFNEGETYDLEFDSYTIQNWIETGYCVEVKKRATKPSNDK